MAFLGSAWSSPMLLPRRSPRPLPVPFLPIDVVSHILAAAASPLFDDPADSAHTLRECSLVCHAWSHIARSLLWRSIELKTSAQLVAFIECALLNAARTNPAIDLLGPKTKIVALPVHQDSLLAFRHSPVRTILHFLHLLAGSPFESWLKVERPQPTEDTLATASGLLRPLLIAIDPPAASVSLPPVDDPIFRLLDESFAHFLAEEPALVEKVAEFVWRSERAPSESEFRVERLAAFAGVGRYVKHLVMPSCDCDVPWLPILNLLLPNLTSLHLKHVHGPEEMDCNRCLQRHVISRFLPIFSRLDTLLIDDAPPETMDLLEGVLSQLSCNLRVLDLNAFNARDLPVTYDLTSLVEGAPARNGLRHLECLRMYGISLQPSLATLSSALELFGATLTAVCIDMSAELTLEAAEIVWNECGDALYLLSLGDLTAAGQHGSVVAGGSGIPLVTLTRARPALRVLRLKNCELDDGAVEQMARLAHGVELVRIALDDEQSRGVARCARRLTDRTLLAFAHRPALRHVSFTWCASMTAAGLQELLRTSPNVAGVELERYTAGTLGLLMSHMLVTLREELARLEVLAISCQTNISDPQLRSFFLNSRFPNLRSISLTKTHATLATVLALVMNAPRLEAVSVVQCAGMGEADLRALLREGESRGGSGGRARVRGRGPSLQRVYTDVRPSGADGWPEQVVEGDWWLRDEGLSADALWQSALRRRTMK
ncbi:hypothetical protein DFJ73DRAFT_217469 [Zopfochytrium polystomum]|nr:hypothetical protein DFJ73DRAFT_217469 [Zopfochytrium polystomum]